jgi:UDP-N-acetylmuramoyl-tripeptide--D-alanyl-D-alanine ligase
VVTYGLSEDSRVRAIDIELDEMSRPSFLLVTPQGDVEVSLPVPGRHNAYNALAAASVALRLSVPLESIAAGLSAVSTSAMRMETFVSASGVTVINDAYNANPSSMTAAVDTLAAVTTQGKLVAVLGDMAELGSLSELAHFHLGEHVARSGVDVLVAVGERAQRIADGARAQGMDSRCIRPCATVDEAIEVLDDLLDDGDTVLVKASRVMGLEAVVEGVVTPRVH